MSRAAQDLRAHLASARGLLDSATRVLAAAERAAKELGVELDEAARPVEPGTYATQLATTSNEDWAEAERRHAAEGGR